MIDAKEIPSLHDLISFQDFEKALKQNARNKCEEFHIKDQKKEEEYK